MLGYLRLARSTFYACRKSRDMSEEESIKKRILDIFSRNKGRYGYRRITMQLRAEGQTVNHKRVQRLMGVLGIKSAVRIVRYRSYKGEVGKTAPNIVNRDFRSSVPLRRLATDVTQVSINGEKGYISPIFDMFNGEILSYSYSRHPDMEMQKEMEQRLFRMEYDLKGAILHSDQGWQYQHRDYQERLKSRGIIQSMSRKGNCFDNAMMENFFGILKSETLYLFKYKTLDEYFEEVDRYIHYYNNERIKLRLGMSPVQYRLAYLKNNKL